MSRFQMEGHVKLFCGWDGYVDVGQLRDVGYVDDVVYVNLVFLDHPEKSGIFNCGTGRAQPFNDVARTVVNTLRASHDEPELVLQDLVGKKAIQYIAFPDDLKGRYQSHTQADLTQLRAAGYDKPFRDVQTGVAQYARTLLEQRSEEH